MSAKRITQLFLIFILLVTSLAMTSKAQAWSTCGSSYTVQRGDWLAKIANHCGVTLSDLYAANPWVRYHRYIYPGQVLHMPGSGGVHYYPGGNFCGPSQDYYGNYYVVCRGDNLSGIALFYGVSVRYLQSKNGIWNASLIYAGQIIRP
jgi:LysM repeat protein